MNRDALADELRRIEHEVVGESERLLADQEAVLVELRQGDADAGKVEAQLELLREQ